MSVRKDMGILSIQSISFPLQAEIVTSKKDAWSSNAKQRCKECLPSCALLRHIGLSNMNNKKLTIWMWYLRLRCYTKCWNMHHLWNVHVRNAKDKTYRNQEYHNHYTSTEESKKSKWASNILFLHLYTQQVERSKTSTACRCLCCPVLLDLDKNPKSDYVWHLLAFYMNYIDKHYDATVHQCLWCS